MKSEEELIERLREIFVSMEIFNLRMAPLEKLAYGLVTLIIVAVISAIIGIVIRVPNKP